MKRALISIYLLLAVCISVSAAVKDDIYARIASSRDVISTDPWYGGTRIKFDFEGLIAWIVVPEVKPAEGNPWTWTMQWATAFVPRTAVPELLSKGWFHVTLEAFQAKATEEFLPTFARFQKYLVEELGLASRACLIGMSWGGFFSARYAAAFPQNVKAVYLDAPLLNFDGGNNIDIGPWNSSRPESGTWTDDPRMPVNKAIALAEADIPVLLLYGKDDQVVIPRLNCELFAARFKAAGGRIMVEGRGMWGHHPHGLDPGSTGKIQDLFTGKLL